MNRRDFIGFLGALIGTIYIPTIMKSNVEIVINSVDDFYKIHWQILEPGTTVYWRGGNYKLRDQQESVAWAGTEAQPIIIKPYNNETVSIDGSLAIYGAHQHWCGFEIYNTRWLTRESQYPHGNNSDIGPVWEAFNNNAEGTVIEDCIIHDCRQGIRAIGDKNVTIRNCIIYNNGYRSADGDFAHAIYWNGDGLHLENCLIMHDYGCWGLHGYGGEVMDNLVVRNNIFYGCVCMARSSHNMTNVEISGNEVIGLDAGFAQIEVGTRYNGHRNVIIENNYLIDANLRIEGVVSGRVRNNVVATKTNAVLYQSGEASELKWDDNIYHRPLSPKTYDVGADNKSLNFAQWQTIYGFDIHSSFERSYPHRARTVLKDIANKRVSLKYLFPGRGVDLRIMDFVLWGNDGVDIAKKKLYVYGKRRNPDRDYNQINTIRINK